MLRVAGGAGPLPYLLFLAASAAAAQERAIPFWDDAVPGLDVAEAVRRAKRGEAAALKSDKRVTNSEGAIFGRVMGAMAFATSAGFSESRSSIQTAPPAATKLREIARPIPFAPPVTTTFVP